MEMDSTHSSKTSVKHKTGFDLEPSREEEKRPAKKQLVEDLQAHIKEMGYTWPQIEKKASD